MKYPYISLAFAREIRDEFKTLVLVGIDPANIKELQEEQKQKEDQLKFVNIFWEWVNHQKLNFLDKNKIVVENTQNLKEGFNIDSLINKQIALKELQKYKHNFMTNKNCVMSCIKIEEIELFCTNNLDKYIIANKVLFTKDNSSKKTKFENML
ncbi:DUF4102 domain-containing protein [Gilliamella sp. M0320]|nr:Arm DNA-binding domain-containing protein [Gilliamella sp. M0320]MBI0061420.1 DUF4102 domain-containing protein [Gilliamella sp. M0320]